MLEKMLFPTDLSEASLKILEHAHDFSKIGVEKMGILFVINTTKLSEVSGGIDIDHYIDEEVERGEAKMPEIVKKVEESGIKAEVIRPFPAGNPVVEIVKESQKYDFVAIGSRGASSFKKILLGSVSEGVLHEAKVPIYVFRYGEDIQNLFERILVAYDFSEWSEKALDYAKYVAMRSGGELHILHVSENESEAELRVLEESLRAEGIDVKIHIKSGTPHKEILAAIDEVKATTVFMGSRGVGGIKAMLLGSTSETVIRRSPVPVFVTKRRDKD